MALANEILTEVTLAVASLKRSHEFSFALLHLYYHHGKQMFLLVHGPSRKHIKQKHAAKAEPQLEAERQLLTGRLKREE